MRVKRSYIVLSFRTTLEAMEWEKQCHARQVHGRLIPLRVRSRQGADLHGVCCRRTGKSWQAETGSDTVFF